ncbi:ABC transporter G family member 20-like [Daktulosphaira vitifoliae]|uniref:ABC transporter G family member 20-like n=1 Tax=Daktulosphaira vitifoliae TaxID=58002 RepID=UPI0021AA8A3E|nr:ABC transporter G family member 20-like [Daktulosphaira vitifoliae]
MEDIVLDSGTNEVISPNQVQGEKEIAIEVKNAVKLYPPNIILRELNMTVRKGEIYGLLGPSGCGKTTLLNSIVGRCQIDSGEIHMKASKREDVGYMPQDLNLHQFLSILQTFKFYGKMLNMTDDKIIERAKELSILLELPPNDRLVDSLSGGQQRRVSLGVALLHNPKILILDEPTVGLDPVLSASIWQHLISFAQNGKTIIITTHYIEEAKQAHTIGLMREGVILAEDSPDVLMARCNANTLEEAFLILSRKQEMSTNILVEDKNKKYVNEKKIAVQPNLNDGFYRNNRMLCLMYKNLSLLWQQKTFLGFIILLPLIQTYFFNLCIGHDPKGLKIGIINNELALKGFSKCSPELFNGCFLNNPDNLTVSCAFEEHLKKRSLQIEYYHEVDIGTEAVKSNKIWTLLNFPSDYTQALSRRVINGTRTLTIDVEQSTIDVWVDLADLIIGNLMRANVLLGTQDFMHDLLRRCNVNEKVGSIPLRFNKPVYGSMDSSFIHYSSAAVLCLCCFFLPTLLTAGLLLTEKKEGMMERMMVSGIQFSEILVSTAIMQMIIHTIQTLIAMYVMYIYFDNPYLGGHFVTISLLLLIGMEGMIYGFLIGAISKDFILAAYVGTGTNLALVFTCGMVWPLEGAHYFLKTYGPIFPVTAPVRALLAITGKGWSIDAKPVYNGFLSIFCWSTFMIMVICIICKIKKDPWVVRH